MPTVGSDLARASLLGTRDRYLQRCKYGGNEVVRGGGGGGCSSIHPVTKCLSVRRVSSCISSATETVAHFLKQVQHPQVQGLYLSHMGLGEGVRHPGWEGGRGYLMLLQRAVGPCTGWGCLAPVHGKDFAGCCDTCFQFLSPVEICTHCPRSRAGLQHQQRSQLGGCPTLK